MRAAALAPETEPVLLSVEGLSAGYAVRPVIYDVSLSVGHGEIVTILGHNGAGKTTTLATVFGLLTPFGGRVIYDGKEVGGCAPREQVQRGMSFTPAERFVFPDLTVQENLRLGCATTRFDQRRVDEVIELFPILAERREQLAGTMSGGQQRMVSVAIALMSGPRLMLLDEPSLGLSPAFVEQIFDALRALADNEGLSVVLLEQNVKQALRIADRAYVMRSGRIIVEEPANTMLDRGHWWDLF
jgi:branched-chain amino acid transport system ATP-binding protein